MTDVMRSRDPSTLVQVKLAVDSATVIEVGDLLWMDTDDVKPPSDQSDAGTEQQNKETFANNFAGIAMQDSPNGDDDDIIVAIDGVFEMECVSASFEVFDLVSVEASADTAGSVNDQTVEKTSTNSEAIAYVIQRESSATTRVLIRPLPIMVTRLSAL